MLWGETNLKVANVHCKICTVYEIKKHWHDIAFHFFKQYSFKEFDKVRIVGKLVFSNISSVVCSRPSLTWLLTNVCSPIFDLTNMTQLKLIILSHYVFPLYQHRFHNENQPNWDLLHNKKHYNTKVQLYFVLQWNF